MGNYTIEHDWDMYCKIPSKRWKIRRIKKGHDKLLMRLNNESRKIWDEIRNLGYESLEKPIPAGYKRLFMLTEDTKYSKYADFYQGILDKINTIRYSSTKVFDTPRTSKYWRRRKRKKKEQTLLEPDRHTLHKSMKVTEDELRMFYEINYYCHQCRKEHTKYVFSEPWRYQLRTRPHYITEVKRKDTVLEQKYAELDDYINQYKNYARLAKLGFKYKADNWFYHRMRERLRYNPLHNTPLCQIENEFREEQEFNELWAYDQKN